MPRRTSKNFGGSLAFNGSTSKVTYTTPANLNLASGFTLSAWVRSSVTPSADGRVLSKENTTNTGYGFGHSSTGKLRLTTYGVADITDTSSFRFQRDKWQHIAVSFDSSGNASFYGDGSFLSTVNGGVAGLASSNFLIGGRNASEFFAGNIDSVRIFNRVLSAPEIANIYSKDEAPSSGQIFYAPLNEMTGTSAADVQGGTTGTITAGTWSVDSPALGRRPSYFMGGSTSFNGSSSKVTTTYVPTGSAITVSGWAFRDNTSAAHTLFGSDNNTGTMLRCGSGSNDINFWADVNAASTSFTGVGKLRKWFHWVVTYDLTTAKLYIDGVLVGVTSYSVAFNASRGNFQIGAYTTAGTPFSGRIADVRLFTTALDASQVSTLYSTGVSPIGPVGQWSLSEQPSTYADAIAGNAGTGTSTTFSIDTPTQQRKAVPNTYTSATGSAVSAVGTIDTTTSGGGTMMGWLKVLSYTGQTVAVFYAANGIDEAWRFTIENNTGYPFIWTINTSASGDTCPKPTIPLPLNRWFHVAATLEISGSNLIGKIYVDGVLWGSATKTRDVRACSRFFIANSTNIRTTLWSAYDRVLTQDEIKTSIQSGNSPSGAKIVWNRNEGAGNINYDSSGNGSNGTAGTLTWYADSPGGQRKIVGGNMVPNGDFELPISPSVDDVSRTTDGQVGGGYTDAAPTWYAFGTAGGWAAEMDTAEKYSGRRSLKLSLTNTTHTVQAIKGDDARGIIPVLPNTSYTLTGRIKTTNVPSNGAYIDAVEYTGANTYVGPSTSTSKLTGTNGWTLVTATFITGTTTRRVYIYPRIAVQGNVCDAWFDEITLTKTTPTVRNSSV